MFWRNPRELHDPEESGDRLENVSVEVDDLPRGCIQMDRVRVGPNPEMSLQWIRHFTVEATG